MGDTSKLPEVFATSSLTIWNSVWFSRYWWIVGDERANSYDGTKREISKHENWSPFTNIVTWSMTTLCDPVCNATGRVTSVFPPPPYIVPRGRVSGGNLSLVNRQYNILLHGGDAEPPVSLFCGFVSVRFCAAEAVAVRDP
ncbi:hypothetical protein OUZ56_024071 [Daphnia magna]|uniref:Uncharacterized protein n=1 Tax=Daphnia magna TaxID=35525 RepID=A0ABR0B036_9CRUS|nr:hypothetical protein OUZ56_024071 [Daphnia magna]